jgi:hypothetical protein
MAALPLHRQVGERVDAEKPGPGDVLLEVALPPRLDPIERVGAVDEPVLDQ